jgi:hypothetical protein
LSKAGWNLVLTARRADALHETSLLCQSPADCLVLAGDVTDEEFVKKLFTDAVSRFGESMLCVRVVIRSHSFDVGRIDLLFNVGVLFLMNSIEFGSRMLVSTLLRFPSKRLPLVHYFWHLRRSQNNFLQTPSRRLFPSTSWGPFSARARPSRFSRARHQWVVRPSFLGCVQAPRPTRTARSHHQQWLALRSHAAPHVLALHRIQTRDDWALQVPRPRRPRVRHYLHPNRHWWISSHWMTIRNALNAATRKRCDAADGAHGEGRAAARRA